MQENIPKVPTVEVPTVEELNKFPWASLAKIQTGIILLLISYIIFSKEVLPDAEREGYNKRINQGQSDLVKQMQETIAYYREKEEAHQLVKLKDDTLNNYKTRIDSNLLPSAKQILRAK